MSLKTFIITMEGRKVISGERDGALISRDDLDDLQQALYSIRFASICAERQAILPSLLKNGEWLFELKRGNIMNPCVYFIGVKNRPNEIKIGGSDNFGVRVRQYEKGYGRLTFYGAFRTFATKKTERAFQAKFNEWRIGNRRSEWFEADPIIAYLNAIREQEHG